MATKIESKYFIFFFKILFAPIVKMSADAHALMIMTLDYLDQ